MAFMLEVYLEKNCIAAKGELLARAIDMYNRVVSMGLDGDRACNRTYLLP